MTHPALDPRDFRTAAAAESVRLTARHGGVPPRDRSLCLPVEGADAGVLRAHRRWVVARLALGIGGLVCGAWVLVADQVWGPFPGGDGVMMATALCCTVGGLGVLCCNGLIHARFTRKHLGLRYHDLVADHPGFTPIFVGVESPFTFDTFKAVPEDLGFLALDPARGTLRVEGLLHRYVVHADETTRVHRVAAPTGASGTVVDCRVGNVPFAFVMQRDSVRHELRRQTIGVRHDPLWEGVLGTLRR